MRRVLIFLAGLFAGSGIGAGYTLFNAPQSGDEMRQGLRDRFKAVQEHSKQAALEKEAQLRQELAELTGKVPPEETPAS